MGIPGPSPVPRKPEEATIDSPLSTIYGVFGNSFITLSTLVLVCIRVQYVVSILLVDPISGPCFHLLYDSMGSNNFVIETSTRDEYEKLRT